MTTSTSIPLEQTYVPAVVASAKTLFSTVLGWQVDPQLDRSSREMTSGLDISGIIGFTGVLRGTIVISFEQAVTFAAVHAFLGETPTTISSDVLDTVAELANIFAGGVKEHLEIEQIALGMPTAVSGHGHTIVFDTGAEVERVVFPTPAGKVIIQIAVGRGS